MSNTKIKIKNITKLIIKACDKKMDKEIFEFYKLDYVKMDSENYIDYKTYKQKIIDATMKNVGNNGSKISYEEIENEMNEIIKAHEAKELKKN